MMAEEEFIQAVFFYHKFSQKLKIEANILNASVKTNRNQRKSDF
jgi:hypothetical protein